MNPTNRRSFIRNAGFSVIGLPFLRYTEWNGSQGRKLPALGVQLYMVKEDMEKDPEGTLSQLHAMGYTQIESFGGNKGIFWGMTHKEFNHLVTDNGMDLVSSHYAGDSAGFEKTAAQAVEIGMKYLIYPWKGPQKNIDDFKKIAEEFNDYGAICKKYGLRFAYHPHDYPYRKVDGQLPINVLLENTDPTLVDFEMDFYYPVAAGLEPGFYIEKYKPRFRLCHMRDVLKERLPAGSEEESATDLGKGMINYPRLLSLAMDNGMLYYFVEQSRFFQETPLQSAKVNADYLMELKLI